MRAEVRALVHGPSYMTFDDVVADFPMEHINTRPPNVPYTPWHLLEHMRIAQRDILEYIEDPEYRLSDVARRLLAEAGPAGGRGRVEEDGGRFPARPGRAREDRGQSPRAPSAPRCRTRRSTP